MNAPALHAPSPVQEPPPSLAAVRDLLKRQHAGASMRSYVREILALVFERRVAVAFVLMTALLEALLSLASPWIAARAIDVALPNSAPSMLAILALAIIAAAMYTAWSGWLHERMSVLLQERLVASTQRDLMQAYLATGFGELQSAEFGSTNVTFAAGASLVQTLTRALTDVVTQLTAALAALIMLGFYNLGLAITALLASWITAGLALLLSLREMNFAARNMGAASQAQEILHVLLRAVTTLRAFRASERMIERWLDRCRAQAEQSVAMETTRLARAALLLAAQQLVTFTATLWLVSQAIDGRITLGVLTTCTMLVTHVLHAALGVTESGLSVFVLRPLIKRVDAMRRRSQLGPKRRRVAVQALSSHTISVQNVWYRYQPTGQWVVSNYSQEYDSQTHTLLRAASGAGKTTLLRLIAGLLTPEHGRVLVCGCDPAQSAGLIAYVPQQSMLFNSSIGANLDSLSGGRMDRALELAELTGLASLLKQLPMGCDTLVAGAGSNLSAGQRQLIVLTAALATEEPVLLLDEAVSQLDARTRERIRWDELLRGRTVISVQHG